MQLLGISFDNWQVLAGLILWLIHTLSNLRIIRSKKIDALYEEAVHFAEQWKKMQGKDGTFVPTNRQVLEKAIEYIQERLPLLHAIDLKKIDATVNLYNTLR